MKQFEEIKKIAAIGTGMIGPDVSLCVAMAGYDVTMMGRNDDSVARGRARFEKNLNYLVDNGVYNLKEAEQITARLRTSTNLSDAVAGSDLVVEAIIEVLGNRPAYIRPHQEIAERFNTGRTADGYEGLFEELLQKKS